MFKDFLISSMIHRFNVTAAVEGSVFTCFTMDSSKQELILQELEKMQAKDSYFNKFTIIFKEW